MNAHLCDQYLTRAAFNEKNDKVSTVKNFLRGVLFCVSLILLSSCSSNNKTHAFNINNEIATPQNLVSNNYIVIDVRTPEEYQEGHINGALNIDISNEMFFEKTSSLNKDKKYIVHCSANVKNGRSEKALKIMSDMGFNQLINMEGGIVAWKKKNYPISKTNSN